MGSAAAARATVEVTDGGQRFVRLPDGGRIAFALHGSADPQHDPAPLLLLRPLGGSMALWGELRERLASTRPVVSFDPRGAGRSDPAPAIWTTRSMARDAIAVLDALGIGRAHVFGLSLGGMVASWLAIDAPERLLGLVLGSTVAHGLDVSARGARRTLSMARCLLRPSAVAAERCLLRRILSPAFLAEHPDRVRLFEERLRAEPASRRGLLQLSAAASLHDARAGLDRIRGPVLLLYGQRDALLSRSSQDALARALPHAELATLADCGHDLSLERPAATAEHIEIFLARFDRS